MARQLPRAVGRRRYRILYEICRSYVDAYNSENNDDIRTNGELALLREAMPHTRRAFDVGSNVGDWSSLVLRFAPHVELHCFEPSPRTFEILSRRNFPPGVVLNNFGLSSRELEADLHVFAAGSGENSLYVRSGLGARGIKDQSQVETVRLRRFDAYCAERSIDQVDFCKMDVEGHELEVLTGMQSLLKAGRVQLLQFEYGGCNIDSNTRLKDFFDFFEGLPYQLGKIFEAGIQVFNEYDARVENYQYQNWVAVTPAMLQLLTSGERANGRCYFRSFSARR